MQAVYLKHIVGEFDGIKQHCVICGEAIIDYTNAMWAPPIPNPLPSYLEGALYISMGVNPTITKSTLEPTDVSLNCNELPNGKKSNGRK